MLVVDLRHWLLPSGEPVPEARLAPLVTNIIECATVFIGASATAMLCPRSTSRSKCSGTLWVERDGDVITWGCSFCSEAGRVEGWEGTRWDLRETDCGEDTTVAVFVPLAELLALRSLSLPQRLRGVLASVLLHTQSTALLPLTDEEALVLLEAIRAALPDARGERRRWLDRALGRIEQEVTMASKRGAVVN